jgi:hypothetical protein
MARRSPPPEPINTGYTVPELAPLLRVSEDRVRAWIKSGALPAINTNDAKCGRPRFIVLPEQLAEFCRSRSAAQPQPAPRRPRRKAEVDHFPEWQD